MVTLDSYQYNGITVHINPDGTTYTINADGSRNAHLGLGDADTYIDENVECDYSRSKLV